MRRLEGREQSFRFMTVASSCVQVCASYAIEMDNVDFLLNLLKTLTAMQDQVRLASPAHGNRTSLDLQGFVALTRPPRPDVAWPAACMSASFGI